MAARWQVAVVPAFLVGYRLHSTSMSNDAARMARARTRMFETARAQLSGIPPYVFDWAMGTYLVRCGWQAARDGGLGEGIALIKQGLRVDPMGATVTLAGIVAARVRARVHSGSTSVAAPTFFDVMPDDLSVAPQLGRLRATRLRWLSRHDAMARAVPDGSQSCRGTRRRDPGASPEPRRRLQS